VLRYCGVLAVTVVLSVLPGPETAAATFTNLYEISLESDPQAANPRADAVRRAMGLLLTRITGSREAAFAPELQPLLENSERAYINSYGPDLQGRIRVGFNAGRVNQALHAANWPVWGAERPLTLLWVAVDDGLGGRAIVSANPLDSTLSPEMTALLQDTRQQLLEIADQRGLPTAFPLLDIEDLSAISFADVWGGFEDRVWAASRRYAPDAVLVGRIRPGSFGPEVQWILLKDGDRRLIAGSTVREGLDWVADIYASEFGVSGDASTTRITVLDVSSLSDYGRVMSYLEGLSVLQNVEVEWLESGVLTLRVAARGQADVLERVLGLGGVLSPVTAAGGPVARPGTLTFEVARAGRER
jgi:hypothetical protein